MFVKPGLRTDDGGEFAVTGHRRVLAAELAEPFLLAEPVKAGGDDGGGEPVGGFAELA